MDASLSPALEDYLETILQLSEETGSAKISEIARKLKIAKPSANQAINNLRREGMVLQERYGPVYLTEKGRSKAQEVWQRHQIISSYLQKVLQVSPVVAEQDACMIEHIISPETLSKMALRLPQAVAGKQPVQLLLSDLITGQKAKIVRLGGKEPRVKKRLLEMGLVPGAVVEVERLAPLDGPLEVLLKGYHLSLRRDEASYVMLELIPED
ncbi:MAG: metal-dependent transcriptional regulator [Syntrophomonadaceae bacterium]|nr:metal-dependent transcriptional regulator [Syntrophomonadaceae bacterium]